MKDDRLESLTLDFITNMYGNNAQTVHARTAGCFARAITPDCRLAALHVMSQLHSYAATDS